MSTTRVFNLPLVVDFLKVKVPPLISVVWSASASDTRQPVNKQMPNKARSRGDTNPEVNSSLNSSVVKIFPARFRNFHGLNLARITRLHERLVSWNIRLKVLICRWLVKSAKST